jgi:hypothetical protein
VGGCGRHTRGPANHVSSISRNSDRNCQLTLNGNVPGLNVDLDPLGDLEQFLGVAVAQLSAQVLHVPCPKRPLGMCVTQGKGVCGVDFERRERAIVRFECRIGVNNVHVLHLEGCCGLAVSTEDCQAICVGQNSCAAGGMRKNRNRGRRAKPCWGGGPERTEGAPHQP